MSATQQTFDDAAQTRLIQAFEAVALDPDAFHHRDHVQLTWAMLQRMSLEDATVALRDGFKRFVASVGKPDRYHETITVYYTMQIHRRMSLTKRESWEQFAERNPDLLASSREFLGKAYRESTIQSDAARLAYVKPDIADP